MLFSVITKNLNCQILTKNLVTFKRWDWVQDEKFYYGGSLKNPILKKPVYRGELPKGGGVFEGVDTPMHTMKNVRKDWFSY